MNITYTKKKTIIKDGLKIKNKHIMKEYILWIIEVRKSMRYHTSSTTYYIIQWKISNLLGHKDCILRRWYRVIELLGFILGYVIVLKTIGSDKEWVKLL